MSDLMVVGIVQVFAAMHIRMGVGDFVTRSVIHVVPAKHVVMGRKDPLPVDEVILTTKYIGHGARHFVSTCVVVFAPKHIGM